MILLKQNKLDKLKNYKLQLQFHKIYALIQLHLEVFSWNAEFIPNRLPHAMLAYNSTGLIGPI